MGGGLGRGWEWRMGNGGGRQVGGRLGRGRGMAAGLGAAPSGGAGQVPQAGTAVPLPHAGTRSAASQGQRGAQRPVNAARCDRRGARLPWA